MDFKTQKGNLDSLLCTSANIGRHSLNRWFTVMVPHCSKSSFFVQKFNCDFTRKIVDFFWVKNSWKCCGLRLFSCWQLWFHEKKCQKNFVWKTRENVVVLDFLAVNNFDFTRKNVKTVLGENLVKCRGFVKIEFLDKNLSFRIVWRDVITRILDKIRNLILTWIAWIVENVLTKKFVKSQ